MEVPADRSGCRTGLQHTWLTAHALTSGHSGIQPQEPVARGKTCTWVYMLHAIYICYTLRAVNGLSIGHTWRGTREAGAGTLRCCVHCKLPNGWCCLVGVRELAARTVRMTPCVLLTHIRTWNISISRTNPRELPARAASQRQQPALRGPRVCVREVPHAGTHKLHVDIGRISVSNFLDRPHPVDVPPDLQHSAALGEPVRAVGRAGLFSHLLQGEVAAVPGLREVDDRNRNLDQCALVRRPGQLVEGDDPVKRASW